MLLEVAWWVVACPEFFLDLMDCLSSFNDIMSIMDWNTTIHRQVPWHIGCFDIVLWWGSCCRGVVGSLTGNCILCFDVLKQFSCSFCALLLEKCWLLSLTGCSIVYWWLQLSTVISLKWADDNSTVLVIVAINIEGCSESLANKQISPMILMEWLTVIIEHRSFLCYHVPFCCRWDKLCEVCLWLWRCAWACHYCPLVSNPCLGLVSWLLLSLNSLYHWYVCSREGLVGLYSSQLHLHCRIVSIQHRGYISGIHNFVPCLMFLDAVRATAYNRAAKTGLGYLVLMLSVSNWFLS